MNKEDFFISQFPIKGNGDDGYFVDGYVYSKDLFFEGIHFKLEWMTLYEIAYKSILVNLSDAIAMNAQPHFVLVGIEIPKEFTHQQMSELSQGLKDACAKYHCNIIGGDTIAGEKLSLSITVISKTNRPIYRTNIRHNDLMVYTGSLGSVKKELQKALSGKKLSKRSKFIKPKLRYHFMRYANRYIHSCMDISDGLGIELQRLSKLNCVGFDFFKPLDKELLCSGEEYELLFAINPKDKIKIEKAAKRARVAVTFFAQANKRAHYRTFCKNHHF
jgi:thiamine-monophosphate kinase